MLPPPDEIISGVESFFCQEGEKGIAIETIAKGVEEGMFIMEDIARDSTIENVNDLFDLFTSDYGAGGEAWKAHLIREITLFTELDFGLYVEAKHNQNLISIDVRDSLIGVKSSFESFLNNTQPTLAQTEAFWQNKINALSTFAGCDAEKEVLLSYYESAIGFARYLYAGFTQNSFSGSTIEFRSCNFSQALLCGTLALVTGVVSGVILYDITGHAQASVILQGVRILEGTPARVVASAVVGVIVAVNMYQWCCSWFGEEPPCRTPQGVGYRVLSCGQYELTVYGAGAGVIEYDWSNTNTTPATATTQSPFLTVSVPNPGQISIVQVTAVCLDQQNYMGEEKEMTLSSNIPGALGWAITPPVEANVGQTVSVAVSAGIAFPQTLSWSASFGGGVSSTGTHTANVTFWASGSVTITATLTNTCTGQPISVSRTVAVKP